MGCQKAKSSHSAALLAIIQARAVSGRTGAAFQRARVRQHEPALGRDKALARMLEEYLPLSAGALPVHAWPDPDSERAGA